MNSTVEAYAEQFLLVVSLVEAFENKDVEAMNSIKEALSDDPALMVTPLLMIAKSLSATHRANTGEDPYTSLRASIVGK